MYLDFRIHKPSFQLVASCAGASFTCCCDHFLLHVNLDVLFACAAAELLRGKKIHILFLVQVTLLAHSCMCWVVHKLASREPKNAQVTTGLTARGSQFFTPIQDNQTNL